MKLNPIITSLLETDLYKLSMGQIIFHRYSDYNTTWSFKCRNKNVHFTPEMVEEIKEQIKHYCGLNFTEEELEYVHNIGCKKSRKGWIHSSYVNYLRLWHARYEDFIIDDQAECGLRIRALGTWLNTSMYEIPVLAIVNETYFRMAHDYDKLLEVHKKNTDEKIKDLISGKYNIGSFSEFGLRRRLSAEAQEYAVKELVAYNKDYKGSKCVGTSNVYLAMKYNVTPVGTMAHEFLQCVGQGNPKHNPAYSNYYCMKAWTDFYKTDNGTYLTDILGDELCRMDMDETFVALFKGVRNDSGDMKKWADNWIKHYQEYDVDPKTKTLLFSNSLDFERADDLVKYVAGRANTAFGIGTWLANDIAGSGVDPLNIVFKVVKCNGMDVAKKSDDPGKGMCENPAHEEYLERCIEWRKANNK